MIKFAIVHIIEYFVHVFDDERCEKITSEDGDIGYNPGKAPKSRQNKSYGTDWDIYEIWICVYEMFLYTWDRNEKSNGKNLVNDRIGVRNWKWRGWGWGWGWGWSWCLR